MCIRDRRERERERGRERLFYMNARISYLSKRVYLLYWSAIRHHSLGFLILWYAVHTVYHNNVTFETKVLKLTGVLRLISSSPCENSPWCKMWYHFWQLIRRKPTVSSVSQLHKLAASGLFNTQSYSWAGVTDRKTCPNVDAGHRLIFWLCRKIS